MYYFGCNRQVHWL